MHRENSRNPGTASGTPKKAHIIYSLTPSLLTWRLTLLRHPGDLSLKISFGGDAMGKSDKLVESSEEVIDVLSNAITPGKWLVDLFPQCKRVSTWKTHTSTLILFSSAISSVLFTGSKFQGLGEGSLLKRSSPYRSFPGAY